MGNRKESYSIGTLTVDTLKVGKRNGQLGSEAEQGDLLPDVVTKEKFDCAPVCAQTTGEVCDGTDTDVHAMVFPRTGFEFTNIGTQTTLCPQITSDGLNIGRTQTNDIGTEVTQGITANSRAAFTVGTSGAFYAKCTFSIADVSGTDDCAFGFRKAEAYQAAIDDYDEMACLNVISGDITIETILNGGATSATDTTEDWADGAEHTLEVYVSAGGVVTFKIDGDVPGTTAAFTFDDDEVVVPFFYFLHDSDLAGAVTLSDWEVGLQDA